MPRMNVNTREEREHIQGLVRQFLGRYFQLKSLIGGTASSFRLERFDHQGFTAAELSTMELWVFTFGIVMARVDREIAYGACRATAHVLIRGIRRGHGARSLDGTLSWSDVAAGLATLNPDARFRWTVDDARAVIDRTTALLYAEIVALELVDEWAIAA